MITFAICGCGSRGLDAYASYQERHPERIKVVAGADTRPGRLSMLRERCGVAEDKCFASDEKLLAQPKLADVMVIATQDRQHVQAALKALDKGYHLLLEKPISPDLDECLALKEKAHETGRIVAVCHVLRYTRLYSTLEALLRRGDIGKLETITAAENVAYWHFAHSFVRGNWRNSDETSPFILAKCCHDMDILRWLAGTPCRKVQSFGSLDYFKSENAPKGAAERCLGGCACKDECPYDAEKIYITGENCGLRRWGSSWPCNVVVSNPTEEHVYDALRTGPYGRCVFHCDNNVADHQTVNIEFEDDIHASFTVSAFTEECYRTIRVTGTLGEAESDPSGKKLYVRRFGKGEEVIDLSAPKGEFAGHGGGDEGIMNSLCSLLESGGTEALTGIDVSVESHVMALAAERSRLEGGRTIDLSEIYNK